MLRYLTLLFGVAILFVVLTASRFSYAQEAGKPLRRKDTVSAVKVATIKGWQESISNEGRFRILFPAEPHLADDVVSVKGLELVSGTTKWSANYVDLTEQNNANDSQLRQVYWRSAAAISENGKWLLRQEDKTLNGKLGSEVVISQSGAVTYLRSFLFRQRMYLLSVSMKKDVTGDASLPVDVQQFFDSFTYWDID